MGSTQDSEHIKTITSPQIEELRSQLKASKLLSPDSDGFAESLKRWSLASMKPAGAVLLAESADDISKTVVYCRKHQLDVAVRGGGHSTAGAGSSDGGVVIDLSQMRKVTVDAEKKTITAQGGCLWGDVDKAGAEHGLATVGGTVDHTGVGGLTLGGGYGWLSSRHGLVVDNLLSAKTVVADGSLISTSTDENADLFWALRGAGQNFGVSIEFTYQAWQQEDIWTGLLIFSPDKIEPIVNAVNKLIPSSKGECSMGVGFGTPPSGFQPIIVVPVIYDGPEDKAKEFFAPLLSLEPVANTATMVPYKILNTILAAPHGLRVSMKGASFTLPLRPSFVQERFADYTHFIEEVPDAAATMLLFELVNPAKITEVSQTATSFANRGSHFNAMIGPMWTDAANDAKCRQFARDVAAAFKDELSRNISKGNDPGMNSVMIYGNYDQYDEKARDIFGINYDRLQKLKGVYDPTNMFNKLFGITPSNEKL